MECWDFIEKKKKAKGNFINIIFYILFCGIGRIKRLSCSLHAHAFFSNHLRLQTGVSNFAYNRIVELLEAINSGPFRYIKLMDFFFKMLTHCPNSFGYVNTWWDSFNNF
jgi:hypothetical protein